jgi:DNA-binding response OmpR family regulator
VTVRRVREKIEDDPADPTILATVWGVGYRLDPGERP